MLNTTERDLVLWQASRQGDTSAFSELFRTYYQILFQYGSKLTPDTLLLEDAIQELFVEIWQARNAPPSFSIKAYLMKALKYKLFKLFRKKRQLAALENDPGVLTFELSHEHFLINNELSRERSAKLQAALTYLSNRQKEIVYLKFYQDLHYDEICAVMDIEYQVARNLLSQAVKSLRKIVTTDCLVLLALLVSSRLI